MAASTPSMARARRLWATCRTSSGDFPSRPELGDAGTAADAQGKGAHRHRLRLAGLADPPGHPAGAGPVGIGQQDEVAVIVVDGADDIQGAQQFGRTGDEAGPDRLEGVLVMMVAEAGPAVDRQADDAEGRVRHQAAGQLGVGACPGIGVG